MSTKSVAEQQADGGWGKYLSQGLLSLNVALACAVAEIATTKANSIFFPLVQWQSSINNYFNRDFHSQVGMDMALVLLIALWTACLFIIVRFLSKLAMGGRLIFWAVGIVSVIAAPVCLLWESVGNRYWQFVTGEGGSTLPRWLAVEPLVAVSWIILLAVAKQKPSFSSSIAFAALHYGLWSWFFWPGPYQSALPATVPVVGLLSYVVWTKRDRQNGGVQPLVRLQ
jgi:hypothetical protein